MKRLALPLLFLLILLFPVPRVTVAQSATVISVKSGNWNDATVWSGGIVPTATDHVTIAHLVTANANTTVAGIVISTNAELRYLATQSVTIQSSANVIVYGKWTMRPANAAIIHTLRFIGIDESKFVGGGMSPIASDVGLWVMCSQSEGEMSLCAANSPGGALDLLGAPKTSWTHLAGSVAAGATQIVLKEAPLGWRVGDTLSIAPTLVGAGGVAAPGFDVANITAITGATVTLSAATTKSHPVVTSPHTGQRYTAEVMNLTRNVRIQGVCNGQATLTGNGRAHIFIRSTRPQSIIGAELNCLGTRRADGSTYTLARVGRYALHFHHAHDGSRGSIVRDTVVRNAGNHALVPHASHGIQFINDIVYNAFEDAVWWDNPSCPSCTDANSDDLLFDGVIVALIRPDRDYRGFSLSGFDLVKGKDLSLTVRNSVAVGVQGNVDAGGFTWSEAAQAMWVFDNNIAHNNLDGIFVWQNNYNPHTITNFVAYRNKEMGVDHGAYRNNYQYDSLDLFGNGVADLNSRAAGGSVLRADGYGQAWQHVQAAKLRIAEHTLGFITPVLFKDCTIDSVVVDEIKDDPLTPGRYDFVGCNLEPSDFTFPNAWPSTRIRVQRVDGTAYQLTGNGTLTTIAPFYLDAVPTPTPTLTPTPTSTPTPTPTATPTPRVEMLEMGEGVHIYCGGVFEFIPPPPALGVWCRNE